MQPHVYKVRRAEDGTPLGDFVAKRLNRSKRAAKALLDRRNVIVNGSRIWMARHPLETGDMVEILTSANIAGQRRRKPIPILYRDTDYLVVNKPPDILACGKGSLETVLRRQLHAPEILAVHRLDRDTSGCLMFAFSETAKQDMIHEFRAHTVTKAYHAIVQDHLKRGTRRIAKPLGGQTAVSHVRVLDSSRNASHVTVSIETGRTHQIRIHLAAIRHPVLGDRKYAPGGRPTSGLSAVSRQMLHARALRFTHPATGKRINITAPLPDDFKACLKACSLS